MDVSVQIVQENGLDKIFYVGPINEEAEVHLAPLITRLSKKCTFNFSKVTYVNSCGVRAWINFMRDVEKDRDIHFEDCTPEIVMQINMIPSFRGSAKISSVCGSYACESCGHRQQEVFVAGKNLPTQESDAIPEVKCTQCGNGMEMEELEDEFFAFAFAS